MKTRRLELATLIVATSAIAGSSFAQDLDMTGGRHARVRQINTRFEGQQDRIAAGIDSGQLTAAEAAHLEKREAFFKNEEMADRQANGGRLTNEEAAKLKAQQNKLNRSIFKQKHDAQTAPTQPKSHAGDRLENQQDRIAQGVKSGTLSPGETARIEAREAELHHQIVTDRSANGGQLTPTERKQIFDELGELSARINKQTHDEQPQTQNQGQH